MLFDRSSGTLINSLGGHVSFHTHSHLPNDKNLFHDFVFHEGDVMTNS